jgi:hypothetical protein
VDFEHLWRVHLYPHVGQDRHEALPELFELMANGLSALTDEPNGLGKVRVRNGRPIARIRAEAASIGLSAGLAVTALACSTRTAITIAHTRARTKAMISASTMKPTLLRDD